MSQSHAQPGPVRSLKERQRAEREELILQAAESMLAERGYHATSMDEIAARVGIAKGTLYLHFPSKEDLVVALFSRDLAAFREFVEQTCALAAPVHERLAAVVRRVYDERQGQRTQLLLGLFASAGMRWSVLETRLAMPEHIERCTAAVAAVLEAGKQSGEIDASIPTEALLTVFFGLLAPRRQDPPCQSARLSPDALADHVLRVLFYGLTAPGRRSARS